MRTSPDRSYWETTGQIEWLCAKVDLMQWHPLTLSMPDILLALF